VTYLTEYDVDAIIGAAVTILLALVGYIAMIARMQQRLTDHITNTERHFVLMETNYEKRFIAIEADIGLKHRENREWMARLEANQNRFDNKLDRILALLRGRWDNSEP
jgi:hypothetical protein